jgi:hypothetical protein
MTNTASVVYIVLLVICAITAIAESRGGNTIQPPDVETGFSEIRGSITRWVITVSSLVLGLQLILFYGRLDNLFNPDIGSKIGAYLNCRQLITDRLRPPPKFWQSPTSISAAAEHLGGGRWQLRGVVDSPTESGGTFHADYTCILQLEEGGRWRAERVTVTPRSVIK